MKRETKKYFWTAVSLLISFVLWTAAVKFVDVQPIGPDSTNVGFATINSLFHSFTGVNMSLYVVTDWLSILPVLLIMGFGLLGLVQWIKRRKLLQVDFSILVLGVFYIVVLAAYLLFETVIINYRPVLIDGRLEASYPSSTTMLVVTVMSTAAMQFSARLKNKNLKACLNFAITAFAAFMVIARLVSGVHWLSDIVGGILLSAGLVMGYCAVCSVKSDVL